jgi:hypothetical protein
MNTATSVGALSANVTSTPAATLAAVGFFVKETADVSAAGTTEASSAHVVKAGKILLIA